jgi:hypothetical protein
MNGHKLSRAFLRWPVFILVGATPVLGADVAATNGVPTISETQRQFLSQLARRTLRDAVLERPVYEPGYVPAALRALETEVVVRLRQHGFLCGTGAGGPAPVAHATRDAALIAGAGLAGQGEEVLRKFNEMLIEIEVVGPARDLEIEGDWTDPGTIEPYIEPGVHGFAFRSRRLQRRFCPTEIFTSDIIVADAIRTVAQQLMTAQARIEAMKVLRFRTIHWYQPKSGAKIVSLQRGLTLVKPEAVTPADLDAALAALGEYMAYRQLPTGLFTYQYESARNVYTDADNLVRQAGAVAAIAIHASRSGKSASLAAADLGVRRLLEGLTPAPGDDESAFIATGDGRNKLGVTALTCIALAQHPEADRYAETRRKLIKGMLWLQRPSGMFITAFPPAVEIRAQEYFPGEALLAMAMDYDLQPTAEVLDAFDRAIAFYRVYFRGQPTPAFVPWQVQAYALIAAKTQRADYVEYVFELTDWLVEHQLDQSNCPWPEMWGGVAGYQPGRAGVATAAYLEGFADALALARKVGDTERTRRYERVVRLAARFVMQLQVRPEETYFIRSPRDAVGAIRTSPSLNIYRIDHCQHALIGLMKARDVLFSDSD